MTTYINVKKPKGKVQKISIFSAYISFILMGLSGCFLIVDAQALGMRDPITASWLAAFVFFFITGGSLMLLSKANLPSFNFDDQ